MNELQSQFEQLVKDLESRLLAAKRLEETSKQQEEYRLKLLTKDKEQLERETKLEKAKEEIETQKKFLARLGTELKQKEERITLTTKALESQRLALIEKEKQVDDKINKAQELIPDLEKREKEVARQRQLDHERKEMLDAQETKNGIVAERLKKVAFS